MLIQLMGTPASSGPAACPKSSLRARVAGDVGCALALEQLAQAVAVDGSASRACTWWPRSSSSISAVCGRGVIIDWTFRQG